MSDLGGREYRELGRVAGPLLTVKNVKGAGYQEVVDVRMPNGELRKATVLDAKTDSAVVQVFAGTRGVSLSGVSVRFRGRPSLWALGNRH